MKGGGRSADIAAAFRQLRDAQPRTWSAAPTTWGEYAARLAPLLFRTVSEITVDSGGYIGFILHGGQRRENALGPPDGIPFPQRCIAFRITRTPEGVTVASVTDGRGGVMYVQGVGPYRLSVLRKLREAGPNGLSCEECGYGASGKNCLPILSRENLIDITHADGFRVHLTDKGEIFLKANE